MSEHFTFGDGSGVPMGWENAPMYNVYGLIRPQDGGFQVADPALFEGLQDNQDSDMNPLQLDPARRAALLSFLQSNRAMDTQELSELAIPHIETLKTIATQSTAQGQAIEGCKSGDPIACSDVFIRRSLIEPFDAGDVARQVEGLSGGTVTCDAATLQCAAGTPRMSLASGLTLAVIVGGVAYAAYRFIRR